MSEDKFINMIHSYYEPDVIAVCEVEVSGYFIKMTKKLNESIRFGDYKEVSFVELDNFTEEDVLDLLEDMSNNLGSF